MSGDHIFRGLFFFVLSFKGPFLPQDLEEVEMGIDPFP